MAEKIEFEKCNFRNFRGPMTLTLTPVIRHTVVHHSLTSMYVPNFIAIGQTFCGWTDIQIDGWTYLLLLFYVFSAYLFTFAWLIFTGTVQWMMKLECGPMPKVMVALSTDTLLPFNGHFSTWTWVSRSQVRSSFSTCSSKELLVISGMGQISFLSPSQCQSTEALALAWLHLFFTTNRLLTEWALLSDASRLKKLSSLNS